ncbi:hypothetical protein HDU79_000886 [Rhizoclosmatium sp. JEL0117]|nr:hypothetical protein HDU79_000886 [Rhizoclosmatium sp. JEL0117]
MTGLDSRPFEQRIAAASLRAMDLLSRARMNANSLSAEAGTALESEGLGVEGIDVHPDPHPHSEHPHLDKTQSPLISLASSPGRPGPPTFAASASVFSAIPHAPSFASSTAQTNFNSNSNFNLDDASLLSLPPPPPIPHKHPRLQPDIKTQSIESTQHPSDSHPQILASTIARFRTNLMTRSLLPSAQLPLNPSEVNQLPPTTESSPQRVASTPLRNNSRENVDSSSVSPKSASPAPLPLRSNRKRTLYKDSGTSPIVNTTLLESAVSMATNRSSPTLRNSNRDVGSLDSVFDANSKTTNDLEQMISAPKMVSEPRVVGMTDDSGSENKENRIQATISSEDVQNKQQPNISVFKPHVEEIQKQMESLEQVQFRMQELNLKFMEHQRILVGQQREAVYDHALKQMENFQDIQQRQSFWQADHLKKLRELYAEELNQQEEIENKVKRIRAIRASQPPRRSREDLDEPVMLVEQDTEPRKRIRKIRLLQVSPPRPQTAVDSQITAVSKAADSSVSENAVFKDLKEQLNSVQKDLQNILQSTSSSTKGVIRDTQNPNEVSRSPVFPKPPVSSQPEVNEEMTESIKPILSKEVQESIDQTMHQFLQVRDAILNSRIKPTTTTIPTWVDPSTIPNESQIPRKSTSSTKKTPFQLLPTRGLKPAAPQPQTPSADEPSTYYHALTRTITEISAKRMGVVMGLTQETLTEQNVILGNRAEPYHISERRLKELKGSKERYGEEDEEEEEDLEDMMEVEGGMKRGRFVTELLSDDRIQEVVKMRLEKALAEGGDVVQPTKRIPEEVKTATTTSGTVQKEKIPANQQAKSIPAATSKLPPSTTRMTVPPKRAVSPQKPIASKMPGVGFSRAGMAKPVEKPKKKPASMAQPVEEQRYIAPPAEVTVPSSPERIVRRVSPNRAKTVVVQEPNLAVMQVDDLGSNEMKDSIEKYHVAALTSKFLHSGKVTQSQGPPSKSGQPSGNIQTKQNNNEKVAQTPVPRSSQELRDSPSPKRATPTIPNFYNVKVANAPVFLRRTSIRPPSLQFLEGSRPDWDTSFVKDGKRRASSPTKISTQALPPKSPTKVNSSSPSKPPEPEVKRVVVSQQNEFAQTMPMTSDLGVQVSFSREEKEAVVVNNPILQELPKPMESEPSSSPILPPPPPKETKDSQIQYQSPMKDASAQYHTPYESSAEISHIEGGEMFTGLEFNKTIPVPTKELRKAPRSGVDSFQAYQGINSLPLATTEYVDPELPQDIAEWLRSEIIARVQKAEQEKLLEEEKAAKEDKSTLEAPPTPPLNPTPPKTQRNSVSRSAVRLAHQAAVASTPQPTTNEVHPPPAVSQTRGIDGGFCVADGVQNRAAAEPGTWEYMQTQLDQTGLPMQGAQVRGIEGGFVSPGMYNGARGFDGTFREPLGPPPTHAQSDAQARGMDSSPQSTQPHSPTRLAAAFRDLKSQLSAAAKGLFHGDTGDEDSDDRERAEAVKAREEREKLRLEEERQHRAEMLAEIRRMREASELRAEQEKARSLKEEEQRRQEEIKQMVLLKEKEVELAKQKLEFEKRMADEREQLLADSRKRAAEEDMFRARAANLDFISQAENVSDRKHFQTTKSIISEPQSSDISSVGISTLSTMISEGEVLTQFYSEGEIVRDIGDRQPNNPILNSKRQDEDATSRDDISDAVEMPSQLLGGLSDLIGTTSRTKRSSKIRVLLSEQLVSAGEASSSSGDRSNKSNNSKISAGEITEDLSSADIAFVREKSDVKTEQSCAVGGTGVTLQNLKTDAGVDQAFTANTSLQSKMKNALASETDAKIQSRETLHNSKAEYRSQSVEVDSAQIASNIVDHLKSLKTKRDLVLGDNLDERPTVERLPALKDRHAQEIGDRNSKTISISGHQSDRVDNVPHRSRPQSEVKRSGDSHIDVVLEDNPKNPIWLSDNLQRKHEEVDVRDTGAPKYDSPLPRDDESISEKENQPQDVTKDLDSTRDPAAILHSLSSIEHHSFTSGEPSKVLSSPENSKSSRSTGSSVQDAREVLSLLSHLSQSSIRRNKSSQNTSEASELRSDELSSFSKSSKSATEDSTSSAKSGLLQTLSDTLSSAESSVAKTKNTLRTSREVLVESPQSDGNKSSTDGGRDSNNFVNSTTGGKREFVDATLSLRQGQVDSSRQNSGSSSVSLLKPKTGSLRNLVSEIPSKGNESLGSDSENNNGSTSKPNSGEEGESSSSISQNSEKSRRSEINSEEESQTENALPSKHEESSQSLDSHKSSTSGGSEGSGESEGSGKSGKTDESVLSNDDINLSSDSSTSILGAKNQSSSLQPTSSGSKETISGRNSSSLQPSQSGSKSSFATSGRNSASLQTTQSGSIESIETNSARHSSILQSSKSGSEGVISGRHSTSRQTTTSGSKESIQTISGRNSRSLETSQSGSKESVQTTGSSKTGSILKPTGTLRTSRDILPQSSPSQLSENESSNNSSSKSSTKASIKQGSSRSLIPDARNLLWEPRTSQTELRGSDRTPLKGIGPKPFEDVISPVSTVSPR